MEIDAEILSAIIKCKSYHKRLDYLGERIWIAEGEECDVVYFDAGNGGCRILQILPKGDDKCRKIFEKYIKLMLEEAKSFDEDDP